MLIVKRCQVVIERFHLLFDLRFHPNIVVVFLWDETLWHSKKLSTAKRAQIVEKPVPSDMYL